MSLVISTPKRFNDKYGIPYEEQKAGIIKVDESRAEVFENWKNWVGAVCRFVNSRDDKSLYLLAVDKKIIGYVQSTFRKKRVKESVCVNLVATHQEVTGKEYGKELMEKLFTKAKKYGVQTVTLSCRARPKLVEFYDNLSIKPLQKEFVQDTYQGEGGYRYKFSLKA